jgi:hypothetical protein
LWLFLRKAAYDAVNFTISSGVNPSPGFPPIVPLIPDIDFIKLMNKIDFEAKVEFYYART